MMRVGDPGLNMPPIPVRADPRYRTVECAEDGCARLVVVIDMEGIENLTHCNWHIGDDCTCDLEGSACRTCGHLYGPPR